MVQDAEINRLLWQGRRGMLELDLILKPFLEQFYKTLGDDDRALYERLLENEDQDLFKWFLGKEQPEDEGLRHIVDVIISCVRAPKGKA